MLPVFMVASDFGICCHGDRLTERARTGWRVCPATGTRFRGEDAFGESQQSGASCRGLQPGSPLPFCQCRAGGEQDHNHETVYGKDSSLC